MEEACFFTPSFNSSPLQRGGGQVADLLILFDRRREDEYNRAHMNYYTVKTTRDIIAIISIIISGRRGQVVFTGN